jgi:hypothetical protein
MVSHELVFLQLLNILLLAEFHSRPKRFLSYPTQRQASLDGTLKCVGGVNCCGLICVISGLPPNLGLSISAIVGPCQFSPIPLL